MDTLSDVRSAIKKALFIEVTDFDSEIDESIRSAIRLKQRSRYWFLEKTDTVTASAGSSSVTMPADFSMPDKFHLIDGSYRKSHGRGFDLLQYDRFVHECRRDSTVASGVPTKCALRGTTLHLQYAPTTNTTIIVDYYKKDATLPTDDNDESVWFDDGFDLIRVLGQFIYEKEYLQGNPDPAVTLTYQRQLDQAHERYERGAY